MKKYILWMGVIVGVVAYSAIPFTDLGRGDEPKDQKWQRIDQSQYVGAAKCAECHQTYYDSWKDTGHNKMIRAPKSEGADRTIFADFSKPDPLRKFELKDVKWVIGHRWK